MSYRKWLARGLKGCLIGLVGLQASAGAALAADWPAFRGAEGDGLARETNLARAWPETGPPELWRKSIGEGYSGLTVVGDRLYTTELTDGEQRVVAFSVVDGKRLWSFSFGTDYQDASGFGNGVRSTPAVHDGRVFAASADALLAALDADSGELLWRNDFKQDFDTAVPRFGFGASPVVIEDSAGGSLLVIETGGTEGRGVVAFDPKTGEVRWTSQDGPASYATPVLMGGPSKSRLVFNRRSGLVALAAETGELLWQHPSALDAIAMPVIVGADRLLISSAAMGDGGHLIEIRDQDGKLSAEKLWSNARFRNHFNTSVAVDGFIYGFDNATLRCLDGATGEARWAHRGYGKGSLVAADGLLFILGDRGLAALVAADPTAFNELGRVQAMEGKSWTSPSLAAGRLFLRDHDEFVAYDVRRQSSVPGAGPDGEGPDGAGPDGAQLESRSLRAAVGSSLDLPKDAEAAVRKYAAARGGVERWSELKGLRLTGSYSAFSQEAPFEQLHRRTPEGELFRLEFESLGGRVTWAKDPVGLWWIFPLLGVSEPQRLDAEPGSAYVAQIGRRSQLEPALMDALDPQSGLKVELLGSGKVGDASTVDLKLTFADGRSETWHLDPETWLEVAVDSTIHDFSQMGEPMEQRAFFGDFRPIGGLMVPHRMSFEFGARLEEVQVQRVELNPDLPMERFDMPEPSPVAPSESGEEEKGETEEGDS